MRGDEYSLILAGGELTQSWSEGHYHSHPGVNTDELVSWLAPDLTEGLSVIDWTRQPSSHFTMRLTADLIELAAREIQDGKKGVTVLSGSDALEEMAYLASLLWSYPQPLVLAAGKKPDGALGSDARATLNEAVRVSRSDQAWGCGAIVCCQGEIFDAAELREASNCGRSGLVTASTGPVGEVLDDRVLIWHKPSRSLALDPTVKPARNVELLTAFLGSGELVMECLSSRSDLEGLIIAGFGGGNVPPAWVPHIRKMLRNDVPIVMVSRTPEGRVTSYSTSEGSFSKLSDLGVIDGGDLTPRRARIKLAVALGAGLAGDELLHFLRS